jgi:hypothetical protein
LFAIRLTPTELSKVNDLLKGGYANKIAAIKVVRDASRHTYTPTDGTGKTRPGVGLAEAKEAVELLMAERGCYRDADTPCTAPANPRARIVPFQPIQKITVDMGSGPVEVDLDGMSLQFLSEMNRIPLSEVAALLDLYNRVNEWVKLQCSQGNS